MIIRIFQSSSSKVSIFNSASIAFGVGTFERYHDNPDIDHWKAAKKVLR
jgi:hypothetical protein